MTGLIVVALLIAGAILAPRLMGHGGGAVRQEGHGRHEGHEGHGGGAHRGHGGHGGGCCG